MKGIVLGVARAADIGDCTNGGISSDHNRLTLVGWIDVDDTVHPMPTDARLRTPDSTAPAVLMRVRQIGGRILSIVPADDDGQPVEGWFMAGGNYACWSDSRVSDLARKLVGGSFYGAVAIHDRKE